MEILSLLGGQPASVCCLFGAEFLDQLAGYCLALLR